MSKSLTIFIVDDHPIIRDGLPVLLEQCPEMKVVGSAKDTHEALRRLKYLSPDVIIVDISMPQLGGLEAITLFLQELPSCRVLVFSMHEKEAYVHRALAAGALGYVVKGTPVADLIEAIRTVNEGEYYLCPGMKKEVLQTYLRDRQENKDEPLGYDLLTEREQQIFRLLVGGSTNRQISASLGLSPKTVEKHRTNIGKKLGTRSLVDMVKYAVRLGIIDPDTWDV